MKKSDFRKNVYFLLAIIISISAFLAFLINTQFVYSPILLFVISIFLLLPFRNESPVVRRIILMIVLLFVLWLLSSVAQAIISFGLAFLIAYIFDPLVSKVCKRGFPRWMVTMVVMVLFIGSVSLIAVFVFPSIFLQINAVSEKVRAIVTTATSYLEAGKIQQLFDWLGIEDKNLQSIIQKEFLPEIKSFLQFMFTKLLNLFKGVSGIATQIINVILIPIFGFYFLKDFDKIKTQLKILLGRKDSKLLADLRRINDIFRVYVGWQVLAASMIAIVCSAVFTIAGVENGILLGILCGFLNPIPYIGLLASWIIASLLLVVVGPENLLFQIIVVIMTVNIVHFVNAYFIEPHILGNRIGLHPLVLIASLFLFGAIFGFIGLLIAVPCTATLMLFYNDWKEKIRNEEEDEGISETAEI